MHDEETGSGAPSPVKADEREAAERAELAKLPPTFAGRMLAAGAIVAELESLGLRVLGVSVEANALIGRNAQDGVTPDGRLFAPAFALIQTHGDKVGTRWAVDERWPSALVVHGDGRDFFHVAPGVAVLVWR